MRGSVHSLLLHSNTRKMVIENSRQLIRIENTIVVKFNLFYRRAANFSGSEFINDPSSLTSASRLVLSVILEK